MARYAKFITAGIGAVLAVLNVFALDQTLSANTLHWITTAIAVITALAVYVVPNSKPTG
jgi:hypothetical protein